MSELASNLDRNLKLRSVTHCVLHRRSLSSKVRAPIARFPRGRRSGRVSGFPCPQKARTGEPRVLPGGRAPRPHGAVVTLPAPGAGQRKPKVLPARGAGKRSVPSRGVTVTLSVATPPRRRGEHGGQGTLSAVTPPGASGHARRRHRGNGHPHRATQPAPGAGEHARLNGCPRRGRARMNRSLPAAARQLLSARPDPGAELGKQAVTPPREAQPHCSEPEQTGLPRHRAAAQRAGKQARQAEVNRWMPARDDHASGPCRGRELDEARHSDHVTSAREPTG